MHLLVVDFLYVTMRPIGPTSVGQSFRNLNYLLLDSFQVDTPEFDFEAAGNFIVE